MYYFVMETTFNKTGSIEQEFGAAVCFASEISGRGFQAAVSKSTGIDSANLNRMIKKGGGCSEDMRRRIVSATSNIVPDFPAKTYEEFLELGRWILDGNNGEDWKPRAHGDLEARFPPVAASMGAVDNRMLAIQPGGPPKIEPNEYETVAMTLNVTRSRTVYKTALLSNIMAFDQAVKGEEELNDLRKGMEQIMAKLEMIQEQNKVMAERLGMVEAEKKRAGNDH